MYEWRKLLPEQQQEILNFRQFRNYPLHNPPHLSKGHNIFHITPACYEHSSIIGSSPKRMNEFTEALLTFFFEYCIELYSWTILPNHYHILVQLDDLKAFVKEHGKFHGRISYQWNNEDNCRGRHCFYGSSDRYIRTVRHLWVTMNYIHNNPVHHGYVQKWQDWAYSSANEFIGKLGRDKVLEIWREYPLKDYGAKWDDFSM